MTDPLAQTRFLAQATPDAVDHAHAIIRTAIEAYNPLATVVLFSGGNDSTVMLDIAQEYADFVFHIRTGIGVPQTYDFARKFVEARSLEWEEGVTPKQVYRDQCVLYGFPGPQQHGRMYSQLKERRLRELVRSIKQHSRHRPVLFLTGLRAFESRRRAKYFGKPIRKVGSIIWCDPILHFDSVHMHEYRDYAKIERNPVADLIHKSGECLCGAYARKGEMAELECWYPEVAAEIHGLEEEVKAAGRKRCVWGNGDIKRLDIAGNGILCSGCALLFEDAK